MQVGEAIEKRRSIKHYDPEHTVAPEVEQRLLDAARLSPTSFNLQHWRFVNVKDPALRQQLREAAWGQAQVTDASMLLVLTGDVNAWQKDPERYWRNVPDQATRDTIVGMLTNFYQGRDQVQRDEVMRSIGIAAQTLMLAAQEEGLAASPMIGFDADKVAELINLPDDHVVGMMLAIGKPTGEANARSGALPLDEVVITDRFAAGS